MAKRAAYRSLQHYKQETGASNKEIAERVCIPAPDVSRYLNNKSHPRPARAKHMAGVLNIPVTSLLLGDAL